jgi:hypothetical protein
MLVIAAAALIAQWQRRPIQGRLPCLSDIKNTINNFDPQIYSIAMAG